MSDVLEAFEGAFRASQRLGEVLPADTLLETNCAMIEKGRATKPAVASDVTIFEPLYIEAGVGVSHCSIGPNVSIGSGSAIVKSELRETIVGRKSRIRHSTLANSPIGDETLVEGVKGELTRGTTGR